MATLSALLSVIIAVSLASERVIELLKKWFPNVGKARPDATQESRRQGMIQLLSAVMGTIIAWLSHNQLAAMLPESLGHYMGWPTYIAIGLMSSGGSGFWNSILDVIRAIKIDREAKAELQVATLNARTEELKIHRFEKAIA